MGTEREFDALASDAIAASEKEMFAEAMGLGDPVADESGDTSLEQMGDGLEGQQESEGEEGKEEAGEPNPTEAKAEGEDKEATARDDAGRFKAQAGKPETPAERGLRNELTGERDKRKAIENDFTSYRSQMEQRFAALEARLAQPAPAPQAKPQTDAPKEEIPDRWTDPDGYDRWHKDQILKEVHDTLRTQDQRRVAGSFEDAKAKHGDVFTEAFKAANAIPENHPVAKQLVDTIMQSPNPGDRLVSWYRQQQAAREIGNDPAAYRAKVQAEAREALMKDPEFRKQLLAEQTGDARGGNDVSPRSTVRLPPSLSSARGGSMNRGMAGGTSDAELFDSAMS